jgi:hypothetical protein
LPTEDEGRLARSCSGSRVGPLGHLGNFFFKGTLPRGCAGETIEKETILRITRVARRIIGYDNSPAHHVKNSDRYDEGPIRALTDRDVGF